MNLFKIAKGGIVCNIHLPDGIRQQAPVLTPAQEGKEARGVQVAHARDKCLHLEEVCANSVEIDGTGGEKSWLALGEPNWLLI